MKTFKYIFSVILIIPVKFYQFFISPILPKSCRHVPTCSNYTIEALKIHGPLKGSWLSMKRIAHCHPWGSSGYDPVPSKGVRVYKFKKYKTAK